MDQYESQDNQTALFDMLHHILQVCVEASNERLIVIDTLVSELNAQAIALNAALNNSESHVRSAQENIGKFDRIAQREFSKQVIAIVGIDFDIKLLQNIRLHARVNDTRLLSECVPLEELENCKQGILKNYDGLVSATLEQKNKVTYLYQQTSTLATQKANWEIVLQRVQKMKNQVYRFSQLVLEIQTEVLQELKRRRRKSRKLALLYLNLDTPPNSDISTTTEKRNGKLLNAMRSLYSHETFIHLAEKLVIDEKQTSLTSFIHCMQSISQVEESVTKIYPRLAELEKEIKLLRQDIEKGKGATARRVIVGYGMLLIELWRRDKYTEIVNGNASLLQNLFGEFGELEQAYRKNFESEIICLDKSHILSVVGNEEQAILPFQMENIDDPPIVCNASSNYQADIVDIVTRGDVQEYIQMIQSFYADNMPVNNEKRSRSMTRDISSLLSRKLEREEKRIRTGLLKLGLPGVSPNGNTTPHRKYSTLFTKI
ncbi:uncharacterized protein EV154DRAFT_504255 [Mucor mucedo]|uniref:uncharacterized protein n=1 Tax=Mucor mucedo TaxID=29922 RepID=UPI00221FF5DF|nr:uncharacterized protein EV154DRAFT_504255 [Mucor mucedo]KAI7892599.1 hypothetical protein EV154DRAFT_504255 [Mucor mucedo]